MKQNDRIDPSRHGDQKPFGGIKETPALECFPEFFPYGIVFRHSDRSEKDFRPRPRRPHPRRDPGDRPSFPTQKVDEIRRSPHKKRLRDRPSGRSSSPSNAFGRAGARERTENQNPHRESRDKTYRNSGSGERGGDAATTDKKESRRKRTPAAKRGPQTYILYLPKSSGLRFSRNSVHFSFSPLSPSFPSFARSICRDFSITLRWP